MPITLTISSGMLTITAALGVERPRQPYRDSVLVAGGELGYSVERPDGLPEAVIYDTEAASLWLQALYGDRINDEVLALLDSSLSDASGELSTELPESAWSPTDLSRAASRVCLAEWLLQWWPSKGIGIPSLDVSLLALELATLKWETPLLFDEADTARDCELLVPELATRLPELVSALADGREATGAELAVWRAAQAATHLLDLDTSAFAAVCAACQVYPLDVDAEDFNWALGEAIDALEVWAEESNAASSGARSVITQADLALAADDDFSDETDLLLTVDPLQVPARSVGGRRENVSVFIDGDANALTILVDLGDVPLPGLMARVWTKSGLLPRMVELRRTPDGYLGATTLDDLDPGSLDVFDERLVSRPRRADEIAVDVDFIYSHVRARVLGAQQWSDDHPGPSGPFAAELP